MNLIGISSSVDNVEETNYLNLAYTNSFSANGRCIPLIIPPQRRIPSQMETFGQHTAQMVDWASNIVDKFDALVLSGGADINPLSYGARNRLSYHVNTTRDQSERALVFAALSKGIPIMGICRGFQILGNLLKMPNYQQDLGEFGEVHSGAEHVGSRHEPLHDVTLLGGFKNYFKLERMCVNSYHHQGFTLRGQINKSKKNCIDLIEKQSGVNILAHTDEVIEAFEVPAKKIYAVQWHPEEFGPDSLSLQYFFDNYMS